MSEINIPGLKKELKDIRPIWERIRVLVEDDESDEGLGSSDWILKLPNESNLAYQERKKRYVRGFENPTMDLITAPGHTIYSNSIKEIINNDILKKFSENCTLGNSDNISLTRFMHEQICPGFRSYATNWVLLDMARIDGDLSLERQKNERLWPYVTRIHPLSVLNYEYHNGELLWFAYKVTSGDSWVNPLQKMPDPIDEIRIWTRNEYIKIDESKSDLVQEPFVHGLGFVPIVKQAGFLPTLDAVLGQAPFFASSRYIWSANDQLNASDYQTLKHSGTPLLMHREGIAGENMEVSGSGETSLKTSSDGNVLVWDGEEKPEYLSLNLESVDKMNEKYAKRMQQAYENEKSAKSVKIEGYDGTEVVKSGAAMRIERDPIMNNIIATAKDCEIMHNKILRMADIMINEKQTQDTQYVEYDKDYDLEPYDTMLSNTLNMIKLNIPSQTLYKERFKRIAAREIEDQEILDVVIDEIEKSDMNQNLSQEEVDSLTKIFDPNNLESEV